MQLVDTHCHIHEADFSAPLNTETRRRYENAGKPEPDAMVREAAKDGVTRLICVGTTLADSKLACNFAQDRPSAWASIGVHPHEAKDHLEKPVQEAFAALAKKSKVVAVGECGLDYYYEHSPKKEQERLLRFQIELALDHNLPLIFHVRDAFGDFWPVFDDYPGIRGVVHSFSATQKELGQILARNLYVGLNGIMTFTKNEAQLEAAKAVPLERLLLETDAPFLTPYPHRGTICAPKHIRVIADFLAQLRGEPLGDFAEATTANARKLFGFWD